MLCRNLALVLLAAPLYPAAASQSEQSARMDPARLLMVHAKIYAVDRKKPWAQSLAIPKVKIVRVGSDEQLARFRGIGPRLVACRNIFEAGPHTIRRTKLVITIVGGKNRL